MQRIASIGVAVLIGCSAPAKQPAPVPVALPAASTACYAGVATGMGQRSRTVARRTVDPAAGQIREDVSHDAAGAHGARSFHVVMQVDGDRFTLSERSGAFSGSGTLVGEPWHWTAWSSTARLRDAAIEVESDDELTPVGLKATKQIRRAGKVLATTTEELATFDCADWDKAIAALALPALDRPLCERACRNYATLKFWAAMEPEIARSPPAERDTARRDKAAELVGKLDAGLPTCVTQCLAAANPAQTACMATAATVDAAVACEQD